MINSGNPANTGTFNVVSRPNLVADPYSGFTRTLNQDFNTADFVATPAFTLGSEGRNVLRQRSFFNWDFSAHKEFRLAERLRLQFRFETYNTFNHAQFTAVDTGARFDAAGNQVNSRLGEYTASASARRANVCDRSLPSGSRYRARQRMPLPCRAVRSRRRLRRRR